MQFLEIEVELDTIVRVQSKNKYAQTQPKDTQPKGFAGIVGQSPALLLPGTTNRYPCHANMMSVAFRLPFGKCACSMSC